jgi:hypothetical protein
MRASAQVADPKDDRPDLSETAGAEAARLTLNPEGASIDVVSATLRRLACVTLVRTSTNPVRPLGASGGQAF